jgi:hypothetical protein
MNGDSYSLKLGPQGAKIKNKLSAVRPSSLLFAESEYSFFLHLFIISLNWLTYGLDSKPLGIEIGENSILGLSI